MRVDSDERTEDQDNDQIVEPAEEPTDEPTGEQVDDPDADESAEKSADGQADDVILIEQIIMHSPTDLGVDTDTSLVSSLRLHLVSEHAMPAALFMDELAAERHHYDAHLAQMQRHPVTDLRFRPGRLMATLRSQYTVGDGSR